jgi:peptide deformylase
MLLPYDHPMLRKNLEYKELTQEEREELSQKLLNACTALRGVGLSANQVGIENRVFVIKMGGYEECFFNPKILETSKEETLFKEGCLSQPGVFITLKRPEKVKLQYMDVKGNLKEETFAGITARIIQHEYDHMIGKNFLDYASPVKKSLALKQAKKKTVII